MGVSAQGEWTAVEIRGLSFAYPDGRKVLEDLALCIAPGERVALIGPNGAGKSTLLLHLNGLHRPQAGIVRVAGLEVNARQAAQVRSAVGMVFQDPHDQLFSPTVFEDVAYGPLYQGLPEPEVRERVAEALAAVRMEAAANRAGYHLSVGEKKRVALATVLAMRPQILVLDEPTAGLDPRGRRELSALLRSFPQTLIAATHDLEWAAGLFPRLVVMDAGRIVADGPTTVLLKDAALLEAHGLA